MEQRRETRKGAFVSFISMTWMPFIRKSGSQTLSPKFLNSPRVYVYFVPFSPTPLQIFGLRGGQRSQAGVLQEEEKTHHTPESAHFQMIFMIMLHWAHVTETGAPEWFLPHPYATSFSSPFKNSTSQVARLTKFMSDCDDKGFQLDNKTHCNWSGRNNRMARNTLGLPKTVLTVVFQKKMIWVM